MHNDSELCDDLFVRHMGSVVFLIFKSRRDRNAMSLKWAQSLNEFAFNFTSNKDRDFANTGTLVLVSSDPSCFLSGGDLAELANLTPDQGIEFTNCMRNFTEFLRSCPVPTVTCLWGGAYGGGAEIALATDYRVTLPDTLYQPALHFWQSKWGVPGGWGGMGRLQEICPHLTSRAVSLLFIRAASLDFKTLCNWNIIEKIGALVPLSNNAELANFAIQNGIEHCTPILHWLTKLGDDHLACPITLRKDLLARTNQNIPNRKKSDQSLFQKHWLSDLHRNKISQFLKLKKGLADAKT